MYRTSVAELDGRIATARAALADRHHLETVLGEVSRHMTSQGAKVKALSSTLSMAQRRQRQLHGFRLMRVFYGLLGRRELEIERNRHEVQSTELRLDEAQAQLDLLKQERMELIEKCARVASAEVELRLLLAQKEAWIQDTGAPVAKELFALAEEAGQLKARSSQLARACELAGNVEESLEELSKALVTIWQRRNDKPNASKTRRQLTHIKHNISALRRSLSSMELPERLRQEVRGFDRSAARFSDGVTVGWTAPANVAPTMQKVGTMGGAMARMAEALAAEAARVKRHLKNVSNRREDILRAPGFAPKDESL